MFRWTSSASTGSPGSWRPPSTARCLEPRGGVGEGKTYLDCIVLYKVGEQLRDPQARLKQERPLETSCTAVAAQPAITTTTSTITTTTTTTIIVAAPLFFGCTNGYCSNYYHYYYLAQVLLGSTIRTLTLELFFWFGCFSCYPASRASSIKLHRLLQLAASFLSRR